MMSDGVLVTTSNPQKGKKPTSAKQTLTRKWIEYMRGMQIIKKQSDPSGKLAYKRAVTSADLVHFLTTYTHLDENTIHDAIETVLNKSGKSPDSAPHPEQDPSNQRTTTQQDPSNQRTTTQQDTYPASHSADSPSPDVPHPAPPTQRRWNNDDAEDVDYRDVPQPDPRQLHYSGRVNARGGKKAGIVSQTPNAINKRNARARKKTLKEAFVDTVVELSEADVEGVFKILQPQILDPNTMGTSGRSTQQKKSASPDDIEKVKNIIKTKMNARLRKMLWQVLQESAISEAYISKQQTNKIFQDVIDNKSYGKLRNKSITLQDLQQAWKQSGFSTDTQDIGDILQSKGFGSTEIYRVFDRVLGGNADYKTEDNNNAPDEQPTPAIIKFGQYIQKHGYRDDIIAFMQQEFGDELAPPEPAPEADSRGFARKAMDWAKNKFGKKTATVEEIRQIFTAMLLEERTELHLRVKDAELALFGRLRK